MSSSRMTSTRCAITPSLAWLTPIVRERTNETGGDSLVRSRGFEYPPGVTDTSMESDEGRDHDDHGEQQEQFQDGFPGQAARRLPVRSPDAIPHRVVPPVRVTAVKPHEGSSNPGWCLNRLVTRLRTMLSYQPRQSPGQRGGVRISSGFARALRRRPRLGRQPVALYPGSHRS